MTIMLGTITWALLGIVNPILGRQRKIGWKLPLIISFMPSFFIASIAAAQGASSDELGYLLSFIPIIMLLVVVSSPRTDSVNQMQQMIRHQQEIIDMLKQK